jgi:predicted Rossmann fold nucleotide-binding protein DprA/Smf involved in DNA uptake
MMFNEPGIGKPTMLALLLCSKLGRESTVKPLTPSEFDMLITRLDERGVDPAALMEPDSTAILDDLGLTDSNRDRIDALLKRGGTIALAIEGFTNRGVWVVGRLDDDYPRRLIDRLSSSAPPLLYGSGDVSLLNSGGVVIVGSRDVDDPAIEFTRLVGRKCALDGLPVISGGARGVDRIAMQTAFEEEGVVIGILAADLEKTVMNRENRESIIGGNMVLATPYNPGAGFNVGNAMGRNKYLYALGDYAIVVSSAVEKGGTWSGAIENLKSKNPVPLFVRADDDVPPGNPALIGKGCIALTTDEIDSTAHIADLLRQKSQDFRKPDTTSKAKPDRQMTLFE